MARRITPAEFRRRLREAERKQKQAIDKYNQAVRKYNQGVKQAVDKYNQAVRAHNARVRANRQRLRSEVQRLASKSTSTSKVTVVYRTSVRTMHEAYARLERDEDRLGPRYGRFLDLSEREAANAAEVTNRLLDEEDYVSVPEEALADAELVDQLRQIAPDLDDRWRGALFALNPQNPDASRHFCTSAREIITEILEIKSPDAEVERAMPDCDRTDIGRPTRRAKIRYLLHRRGMTAEVLEDFVTEDVENILELFHVFNKGTHGAAGRFALHQLQAIRKRVKDGLFFLAEIARMPSE
jgi:hypothetical protein